MDRKVVPIAVSCLAPNTTKRFTSVEMCAGGGGQALGLEGAGFDHLALVELDKHSCKTLKDNRPEWNVVPGDLREFDGAPYAGADLLAGGLPCPPFSRAGKQLGDQDERNLFPTAIKLIKQIQPRAVMIENVRGILDAVFQDYRRAFVGNEALREYTCSWKLLNASDFGVPQLRPRVVFVAIRNEYAEHFLWPTETDHLPAPTVGDKLFDLIGASGWRGAKKWRKLADEIAPTIVGGSLKHGGPDLGPTRAKRQWATLGVDGLGIANTAPERDYVGLPRLTVRMVARLQGFPDDWEFAGGKTASYRQIGNAFPPPVAQAVASKIHAALFAGEGALTRRELAS